MRSKALAKTLSGKKLTLIQNIICVVLIVVMAFASFGTIFTVKTDLDANTLKSVNDLLSNMKVKDATIEIPEEIDVSLPFMIRSIGSLADVMKAAIGAAKDTMDNMNDLKNAEDEEAAEEALKGMEDAKNKFEEMDVKPLVEFAVFFFAIFTTFKTHWMVGLCNLLLLFLVFILPLVCIIAAIRALIAIFSKKNDPGQAFHKIAKALGSIIAVFPLLLVVMAMVPEVAFGGAVTSILTMCIIALVVNLVVSRLKYYDKADFTYLNTVQAVSAGSLIAYLVFFTNLIKSGFIKTLFERLGKYTVKEAGNAAVNAITKNETAAKPDFVPVLLTLVFVVLTIIVINYLSKIVTRIACMSKSKSDAHLATGIVAAITAVLPFVLMGLEKFKLQVAEKDKSTLTVAVVGLFLILACEIVMMVLSKTLCSATPVERRREIVTGAYIYVEAEEEVVAEEAVAEEAPAEEAAAEEAPAEEAAAEEAPAEEAVAEEAPAEEAAAEEAPAEEKAE